MAAAQHPREYKFDLSGGHVALDFANTVSRRDAPERSVDHIVSPSELLSFAAQTRLLSPHFTRILAQEFTAHPSKAAQSLRNAIALREALFRVFQAAAAGKPGAPADIALIEKWNAEALLHRKMVRAEGSYAWTWDDKPQLERMVWPIALAAADLLTSGQLAKVRECEASDCAWLFLDTSRNHSRRWCAMSACGNREKARRHYLRRYA